MTLQYHHLFTHAGCLDGSGAAILFMHAGGLKENIHWVKAGTVEDAIEDSSVMKNPNTPVLLVDICPVTDAGIEFLHDRGNYHVIDHHKHAEPMANRPDWIVSVGNKACGTEMFRQWLVNGGMKQFDTPPYKRFASLIDDHDRWVLQQPMSIEVPRLFAFIGQKKFVEWFYDIEKRFMVEKEYYWYPEEQRLLELLSEGQSMRFDYLIKNKFKKFDSRDPEKNKSIVVGYIISAEVNCSELLADYLAAHPEVDVAAQINMDLGKVSVRSNGRVDLSQYAKLFGGGGHRNSAGYPIPHRIYDDIVSGIHDIDGFE